MKKHTFTCVVAALAVACTVAIVLAWHVFSERTLETVDLPWGDKIVISYYLWRDGPLRMISGAGALKYHIYSGDAKTCGMLTHPSCYDSIEVLNVVSEIKSEESVKIEDGCILPRGWVFKRLSSGEYEITKLHMEEGMFKEGKTEKVKLN